MQNENASRASIHLESRRSWKKLIPASLPPLFTLVTVVGIYASYVLLHLMPMLQLDKPAADRAHDVVLRGMVEAVIFHILVAIFMMAFLRTIFTEPGVIPDGPQWCPAGLAEGHVPSVREVKADGRPRYCKWCNRFKPDRCHHCRVCQRCVLRMDHHCPWIMSCIGFHNHKYFFLLISYGAVICWFVVATMFESVRRSEREEMSIYRRFLLAFGFTIPTFMGLLVSVFTGFHIYIMIRAMTTIEFCEKMAFGKVSSPYDKGTWNNICAVLGPDPFLWAFPVSPPVGDGAHFRPKDMLQEVNSDDESSEPEWTVRGIDV